MAQILVTQQLLEGSLDSLVEAGHQVTYRNEPSPMPRHELLEGLDGVDALICTLGDSIDAGVLERGSRLRVVANVAVGCDNIDLVAARTLGVAVCNTPGVLDDATADVAMLLILAALRRTSEREAELRRGAWEGWGLTGQLGLDLSGATLGLVGYGRIARAVARRATGFDMKVLHHTRTSTGEPGWTASLLELASACDALSVHVPLTVATEGLISREVLGVMRPTSVLVNTARGAVVDEEALAEALEEGRLFGAGLDVYVGEPRINPRLLAAPHAVLLPHIGSATIGTRRSMCRLAIDGVLAVLAGGSPPNLVTP